MFVCLFVLFCRFQNEIEDESLILGEASCQLVKTLKELSQEFHVVRKLGLSPTARMNLSNHMRDPPWIWRFCPAKAYRWPVLEYNFTKDAEPEPTAKPLQISWSTEIVWDNACFKLWRFGIICYTAVDKNYIHLIDNFVMSQSPHLHLCLCLWVKLQLFRK